MFDIKTLNDRDLLVRSFQLDDARSGMSDIAYTDEIEREAREAEVEVERRFGEGANDRLADWFTHTRATHEEMVEDATERTERVVEIARGHDCDNDGLTVTGPQERRGPRNPEATSRRDIAQCWCGRVWFSTSDGRGWYDPTEGTDPTAPHESASTPAETQPSDEDMQRWADRQFYGHA